MAFIFPQIDAPASKKIITAFIAGLRIIIRGEIYGAPKAI
jgi:hypothetical protein